MKVASLATRALYLLETHNEPEICEKADCDVCSEILEIRKKLNGKLEKKKSGTRNKEPKFSVIDENGKEKIFYIQVDVIRYVRTTRKKIIEMVETGCSYNGFTVTKL